MDTGFSWQGILMFCAILAGTVAALVAEPVAQDPVYHLFADRRTLFGVPNFADVMSNLPFAVVGAAGLLFVARDESLTGTRPAWVVFYAGVFLTAFGSGYYHLAPNNETLVWDRLSMTVAFMGFVAIVIGEYLSGRAARRLLIPLLLAGAASVLYWAYSESSGNGDLRAYALVQFLPMLLIPIFVLTHRGRSDLGPYIGWMILIYAGAKLLEFFDGGVFSAGGVVSGHSLKHVFAAMAPACLLYGLMRRRYHAART